MKQELQEELIAASEKLKVLQDWLINHTTSPDFITIAKDRNHLLIKINAIEYKINQLERGLPILGEPEELLTVIQLEHLAHEIII
jgi:hypothetical protein